MHEKQIHIHHTDDLQLHCQMMERSTGVTLLSYGTF